MNERKKATSLCIKNNTSATESNNQMDLSIECKGLCQGHQM